MEAVDLMNNQVTTLLSQVLANGTYYAAVALQGDVRKQKVLHSIEEFSAFVTLCNDNRIDAYFGLSTFKQSWYQGPDGKKHFRTRSNADRQKALWLDIDAGLGKPYPTVQAAADAVNQYAMVAQLPAPTLVCSGGGVHAYWPFIEEVETATWLMFANGMHVTAQQFGLHADPARTRDPASILRVPGSYNYKLAEPRPVYVLQFGTPVSAGVYYERFKDIPMQVQSVEPVALDMSALVRYDNVPMLDLPVEAARPQSAEAVIAGCEQVRNQLNAQEPVWRGMLSIMTKCDDGDQYAHTLSALDPRYDHGVTEQKIISIRSAGVGPYLCETFDALRPGVCVNCPNRGRIKSPITLSTEVAAPVQAPITVVADGRVETFTPPQMTDKVAKRYEVSEFGCTLLKREQGSDGSWTTQKYCFRPFPVYPVHVLYHQDNKAGKTFHYIWRFHGVKGYEDVAIEGSLMASGQGLRTRISAAAGIGFSNNDWKIMEDFMRVYLENVKEQLLVSEIRNNLGWDKKFESFVLGTKLYRDGQATEILVEGDADLYATLTRPSGTLDAWKHAANVYNRPGMEWAQTIVCTAFASPLMGLGALERAALLAISGARGHGKSAAQQVALAVYGSPSMLMPPSDTPPARIHKLGIANSIAVAMDELTDMGSAQASEFVYTIPSGVGKSRMAQGGTGLLENHTRWSTLPTISLNGSILDILSQHSSDATAQMSRVLEIKSTDPKAYFSQVEMEANKSAIEGIADNYGHAGDAYIRAVTKHKEAITALIKSYEHKFTRRTGLTNTERFWSYMAVRIMIGAVIAKELGLVQYDLVALEKYIMAQALSMKQRIIGFVHDPSSWLGDFRAAHAPNILRVNWPTRPRTKADGTVWKDDRMQGALNDIGYVAYAPANREIVGRYVLETDELYISKAVVKQWCMERRIPYSQFEQELLDRGLLLETGAKRQKRDIGVGTEYRGMQVTVLYIKGAQLFTEELL